MSKFKLTEAEAKLIRTVYKTDSLIDCEINESILSDLKSVFESPRIKNMSLALLIGLLTPVLATSQSLDTIQHSQGAEQFLQKVSKITGNKKYNITIDSLSLMSGKEFRDLLTSAAFEYAKSDPNFYIKGTEPKGSKIVKTIKMIAPEFIKTPSEKSRFDKQFSDAVKKGKNEFLYKRDNGEEVLIAVKIDKGLNKPIAQADKGKITWIPAVDKQSKN